LAPQRGAGSEACFPETCSQIDLLEMMDFARESGNLSARPVIAQWPLSDCHHRVANDRVEVENGR